jgi:hypothetical protein
MQRRTFLLGTAVGALGLGAAAKLAIHETTPSIAYPGMREGHWLRDSGALPAPTDEKRAAVAILGSGVAGLSCAWQLARRGHRDFVVVAGPEFGGNACGGGAGDLAYPQGAHYLPLPSRASTHVREMLAEFGVILDGAQSERPYMDEAVVVHGLDERLLRNGRWEDNLVPPGATPQDQAQHVAFFRYVEGLRTAVGKDGRKLFCIPIALSSQDAEWCALDRLTFKQWLLQQGYSSPVLHWYLDYCCRDDYGAPHDRVSAWAGLHYFASRDGHASNAPDGAVLTWPNGLARMVEYLRASITRHLGHDGWLLPGTAMRLQEQGAGLDILVARDWGVAGAPVTYTLRADRAVSAMPLFVAAHVVPHLAALGYDHAVHQSPHAPWVVSNFTLEGFPQELPGAPLAWDNVVYEGPGLGYVVSTHQLIRVAPPPRTVFTAYQAVSGSAPDDARRWLERADAQELRDQAAIDLLAAYGEDFWRKARRLDITVRGHAMATPAPGYLGNPGLAALREADGRLLFAHADLSGYSVFEEASWWGVRAASRILGEA